MAQKQKINLSKNDRIEIKWVDIVQQSSWSEEDEAAKKEVAMCTTLGYFLNRNQHVIRLSSTLAADGDRDITVIPKGCVKEIYKLEREQDARHAI
jgi:hypothetical protein